MSDSKKNGQSAPPATNSSLPSSIQSSWNDLVELCKEQGYKPDISFQYKEEVGAGMTDREKKLVEYVVSTYINASLEFKKI